MRKARTFFIQNKLHWHIQKHLCGSTLSENLRNIYQLRVFWISKTYENWSPFSFIFHFEKRK